MTAAIDIIQDALESIGSYAPGDTISAADASRGLTTLNRMLELWDNQNLACFAFLTQSIVLINAKQTYTIGPGGDIDGTRPLKIEQVYLVDSNGNRYNVNIRTLYEFNLLANTQVTSTIPTDCYYDPQVPLGILKFWPIPQQPMYTAKWTSFLQLTEFENLYDQIDFPVGYDSALRPNLAVLLCKYFGKAVPVDVRAEAMEAFGILKRKNLISQASFFDPAIVSRPTSGGWNILSGAYNGGSNTN